MTQKEQFETRDIWLASALTILLSTPPEYKTENGQTIFVFPRSDKLYKAIADYSGGCLLSAYSYAQVNKRLRSEMIMRRGNGGQR